MSRSGPILRQSRFITFDGSVAATTKHQRPDRYHHLETDLGKVPRIARGGGYSYSAASFGEDVLVQEMSAFNRFLAFDEKEMTVRVEAGATVGQVLGWARSRNLYPPVLPGYPAISIGGCVAADVHGKNPLRDGTFCDWVTSLTLFSPTKGFHTVTRESNEPLFEATCGGFGLTGLIVDATLKLARLPSTTVAVHRTRISSFAETIEKLSSHADSDFVYSWHDGTARGSAFGRGLFFRGEWVEQDATLRQPNWKQMSAEERARLPISFWNRATARLGNTVYSRIFNRREQTLVDVFDAAFPFAGNTAYHRLFGRPGLAESQLLIPHEAVSDFLKRLCELLDRREPGLIMMSLKPFRGKQHSLSMTGDGLLLALDLCRDHNTNAFLSGLDNLVIEFGLQPNVAKDSRLSSKVAARALPGYSYFKDQIARLHPRRLYRSEMSRRLGL